MKIKTDDGLVFSPLEVQVTYSLEDAIRKFKSAVQAEGIIATYKDRMSYEKPSEAKRRKQREAEEARRIAQLREAQMASGEWDKRQKRKEEKRLQKAEERSQRKTLES